MLTLTLSATVGRAVPCQGHLANILLSKFKQRSIAMTKPKPTPDRIAGSKARRRIHVDGEINTVLFPGIRKFVFAILDAGYSPETVSSVTEKAIQDWQEYHQGWGESRKSRKAREWANQQKCSPEYRRHSFRRHPRSTHRHATLTQ